MLWLAERITYNWQGIIFSATLLVLAHKYWGFRGDLFRFLIDHGFQALILILLFAMIYGQIGTGLGLPLLFWSEEPLTRWLVAVCSTLLLAIIGLNGYYLLEEDRYRDVMKNIFEFLGEPYPNRTGDQRGKLPSRFISGLSAILFADFKFLDPKEPPVDQAYSNPYQLSRFLRLVRLPFLTLLALPALLPGFFVNLPRFAPVVQNIQERRFHGPPLDWQRPDVADSWGPYLYAAAVWLFGIWCGVVIVKLFIKASDFRPAGKRNRWRSILVYLACAAVVFLIMAVPTELFYEGAWVRKYTWLTEYRGVTPGVAILAMMALMALLVALISLLLEGKLKRWRLAAVLALLACIALNNSAPYSYQFENLNYSTSAVLTNLTRKSYLSPEQPGAPKAADEGCDPLVLDVNALDEWKKRCQGSVGAPGDYPKLVVVCTSGGAIRAGYWTATVLDRLGEEVSCQPEGTAAQPFRGSFHSHVRVITGASGGMVGASYYVTWLRHQLGDPAAEGCIPLPSKGWIREIPIFSLSPVARSIALRDPFFTTFRQLVNLANYYPDRGIELERDWRQLRYPLSDLRAREVRGELPSLILSPMTVEDGRRLLISNLDLRTLYDQPKNKQDPQPPPPLPSERYLALNVNSEIHGKDGPPAFQPVSLSSVEFFKVFCPREKNGLLLSTAARMNASFPYVSPAVNLPTNPTLRVVDAGYYDNYGVDLAAAWIFANRFWIEKNTSGVLIVQIRDALSSNDRLWYPIADNSVYAPLLRGLQLFFSPIEGVSRARYSSSSFRNDALIAGLSDYFSQRTDNRDFVTTAIFELASRTVQPIRDSIWEWPGDRLDQKIFYADSSQSTEVAMSWYLTVAERQAIDMAIPRVSKPDGFVRMRDGASAGAGTDRGKLWEVLHRPPGLNAEDLYVGPIDLNDEKARQDRINELEKLAGRVRKDLPEGSLRDRSIYVIDKELARAQNYERFGQIARWWTRTRPKSS